MPGASSAHRPRALVVAYDFPPHGAIGTMRTLRLVQQLAAVGWDVKVLTSDPRGFRFDTPLDEALLERIPSSVAVVRAPAFRGFDRLKDFVRKPAGSGRRASVTAESHNEGGADLARSAQASLERLAPRRVSSRLRRVAGRAVDLVDAALAIPDSESAWLAPALTRGLQACRGWQPDVLYSSAPPWTGQLVARSLAAMLGCPWVADFRDPWARAPWRETRRPFVRRANNILERSVVNRADALLFVTRANLDEFADFYGAAAARRFHLIPNGCDPSEFDGVTAAPQSDPFVLLHAGSLYEGRNPLPVIRHVAAAIDRGALSRDRFRLRLVGPIVLSVDLAAECRRLGVDDVVQLVPRVSRRESLTEMASASALLLLQPVTTVSVPGKAYEYLAAGRPVLALAEEGETSALIRASGIGVSIPADAGIDAFEAALSSVIGMASKPCAAPPQVLYDGRVHAAAAAEMLSRVALLRRSNRNAEDEAAPAPAARSVPLEGPPR